MIALTVGVKAYLIYFLFRRELAVFVWIVWKNPIFWIIVQIFWILKLRTDIFNGFL